MWERQGRAVKESELGQPAKEVRKRGAKDEPVDSRAAEEEAEVRKPARHIAGVKAGPAYPKAAHRLLSGLCCALAPMRCR